MVKPASSVQASGHAASSPGIPRRGFLGKLLALALGAVALAAPAVLGLVSAVYPLRLKGRAGQLFRVALLDVLPEDGTPGQFPIIADRKDAWTRFPSQPIGWVFLRRTGPKEVKALAAECPHAGCQIGYDTQAKAFLCPCHVAHFDLEGKRTDEVSQSPRDMDSLDEVEIRGGEVWVKFEKYRNGTPNKIAEA